VKKKRVFAYIDGLNIFLSIFYSFALESRPRLLWHDPRKVIQTCLFSDEDLECIKYYYAFPGHLNDNFLRRFHSSFPKVLRAQGVQVTRSYFKQRQRWEKGRIQKSYEEKGTDVLIAVDMIDDMHLGICDKLALVSADTDFIPAVRRALDRGMEVLLLAPPGQTVKGYRKLACEHENFQVRKIDREMLEKALLPEAVAVPGGEIIRMPK